jgi:hypothetical protein
LGDNSRGWRPIGELITREAPGEPRACPLVNPERRDETWSHTAVPDEMAGCRDHTAELNHQCGDAVDFMQNDHRRSDGPRDEHLPRPRNDSERMSSPSRVAAIRKCCRSMRSSQGSAELSLSALKRHCAKTQDAVLRFRPETRGCFSRLSSVDTETAVACRRREGHELRMAHMNQRRMISALSLRGARRPVGDG